MKMNINTNINMLHTSLLCNNNNMKLHAMITTTSRFNLYYKNNSSYLLGKQSCLQQQKRHDHDHLRLRAAVKDKPSTCTADELHYVEIPNTHWRLALWRYLPAAANAHVGTVKNHPLLLLSGVGTNAIGYDLSPQYSFARHMSGQGFDTWILEVRGAGLSKRRESVQSISRTTHTKSKTQEWGDWVSDFTRGQTSIPLSLPELNKRLAPVVEEFHRQVDLFQNSDWDLDQCIKEDLPLVIEYIKRESKPKDGKLLAIGHSMGGISLYAMLSLCAYKGEDSHFAAVTTLASSLDYSSSKSSLKMLLPLVDPAQALKIPAIPIGVLFAAMFPLASRPPFLLSWLNSQISAQGMMVQDLFERLVLKNFCTVPANLLLQLTTAFESSGLCDRSRTFFYKNHLHRSNVPILALAGDQDLICPPEAVYETVKKIPEDRLTFRVFGEPDGPHYAHYDLVGGRFASKQVYPCILQFLSAHDRLEDGSGA